MSGSAGTCMVRRRQKPQTWSHYPPSRQPRRWTLVPADGRLQQAGKGASRTLVVKRLGDLLPLSPQARPLRHVNIEDEFRDGTRPPTTQSAKPLTPPLPTRPDAPECRQRKRATNSNSRSSLQSALHAASILCSTSNGGGGGGVGIVINNHMPTFRPPFPRTVPIRTTELKHNFPPPPESSSRWTHDGKSRAAGGRDPRDGHEKKRARNMDALSSAAIRCDREMEAERKGTRRQETPSSPSSSPS